MAWSLANKASNRDGGSPGTNTFTLTITSSTSGRCLVAHILLFDSANRTITGVAGNTGGAWTQHFILDVTSGAFDGICVGTFYLDNCPAGVTSVTVTCSGATQFKEMAVYELVTNGVAVVTDGVVSDDDKAAVGTVYTGETLTTTGAGTGAAFGFYWDVNATQNPTTGNEFDDGGEQFASGSDAVCCLLNPTSAAHTPTWVGGLGGSGGTFTVAFKDIAAAGPPFLGVTAANPLPTRQPLPSPLAQSLLQTTLAQVAAASPFFGRTGDVPRPALRSRELLTWTSYYTINDNAPFTQEDWPNPTRGTVRVQGWTAGVNDALVGPPVVPFAQRAWPNPVLSVTRPPDWSLPLTVLRLPHSLPFSQDQWPNPMLAVVRRQDWIAPLTVLRLPQGAPFSQDQWPNPVLAKTWNEGLWWQDRQTTLLVAPTVPFRQALWPNPAGAAPGIVLAGFTQASAFWMLQSAVPFTGLAFVVPYGAQFPIDLRGSAHNALTTVPTPPVVTFNPAWAVNANRTVGWSPE
jgi:hypothetical protein